MTFSSTRLASALLACIASVAVQPALASGDAGQFTLPSGHFTYGDANVYGLQLGCTLAGANANACPYHVTSTPGAIKDLVVIGTGSSGVGVTTNFTGMDDAFAMPSGRSPPPFFRTGGVTIGSEAYPAADPGGAGQFAGDQANTWDTTLSALKLYLQGQAPVFFFNNNQVNSGASTNQYLASWGQAYITDASNNIVGIFDLTGNNGLYKSPLEGGAGVVNGDPGNYTSLGLGNPTRGAGTATDYILTGGPDCLDAGNNLVPCNSPTVTKVVNNNLGADQAALAVVLPELNGLLDTLFALNDLNGYALHLDLRFGCDPTLFSGEECVAKSLNNGYEQIFMGRLANETVQNVPEPGTLPLLAGLLGVLAWSYRLGAKRGFKK
jgi:hypothetical protein